MYRITVSRTMLWFVQWCMSFFNLQKATLFVHLFLNRQQLVGTSHTGFIYNVRQSGPSSIAPCSVPIVCPNSNPLAGIKQSRGRPLVLTKAPQTKARAQRVLCGFESMCERSAIWESNLILHSWQCRSGRPWKGECFWCCWNSKSLSKFSSHWSHR